MGSVLKSFQEFLTPESVEHSIYLWGLNFVGFFALCPGDFLRGSRKKCFRTVLSAGFFHHLIICVFVLSFLY